MLDSTSELRTMIEFASNQIEKQFRHTGKVSPMYHAITATGETLILPSPHADKDIAVALIKALFALRNVERYVFMDEAWILDTKSRLPGRDEWRKIKREGLSDHPDRREILMFSAENRRGGALQGHRYILRPEHGKAKLTPLEILDMTGGISTGRMVGLLK